MPTRRLARRDCAILGQALGPATLTALQVNSNGTLSNSIGGVQVFFNGYAAPMIYALGAQLSAVVPYEVAGQTTVNVVVVYQGNASAPFPVPVAAASPPSSPTMRRGMARAPF